jgi:hypothetical protein
MTLIPPDKYAVVMFWLFAQGKIDYERKIFTLTGDLA